MINQKIIDKVLNITTDVNGKKVKPLIELKKYSNLDILTLDDFMEKYERGIADYIDTQNTQDDLDEEDLDEFINKITARELSYKCMYFNEKYPYGDRNVSDDYIFEIVEDYFETNEERHTIMVAVDTSARTSYLPQYIKQTLKKKNSKDKRRLQKRYSYENPFHRIHGFLITQDDPCKCPPNIISGKAPKISALTVICAGPFASQAGIKAVGSYLLCFYIYLYKSLKYDFSVLEVANDHAIMPDYDLENEDYDEDDLSELKNLELKDILQELGLSQSGKKEILINRILKYQEDEKSKHCSLTYKERLKLEENVDEDDIDEYGYGGIYYHQGRDEKRNLYCNFYEKVGYKENSKLNTQWNCFSNIPYPSMILDLKKQSFECIADIFLMRTWARKPSLLCQYGNKKKISLKCS
jgi:hypothetical protein